MLLYSAYACGKSKHEHAGSSARPAGHTAETRTAPIPPRMASKSYHVTGVPGGFALMFVAGNLSGLLGIGSGAMKVVAMDRLMRIPFKVSTTTSNFMIGVTAAASAGVYMQRGYIDPGLSMPVMLGVLAGSLIGARLLPHTSTSPRRWHSASHWHDPRTGNDLSRPYGKDLDMEKTPQRMERSTA